MKKAVEYGRDVLWANTMTMILLRGILLIILGVCFIINPDRTFAIFTYVLGAALVIFGIPMLISGLSTSNPAVKSSMLVSSCIMIAAGLFLFFRPGVALQVAMLIAALLFIVSGAGQIVSNRGVGLMAILSGVLSILLGVLLIAAPFAALDIIGMVVGIYLVAFGVFLISLSRTLVKKI